MTMTQPDPSIGDTQQGDQATTFEPIPTRIRDARGGETPPLVLDPAASPEQAAIRDNLDELGSKLASVHRTAAEGYLSQGGYEQALPHLVAASTFAPGEIEYRVQLGVVQYICGDDAGAIRAFNEVISAEDDNVEAWFNLGMVIFGQEQFSEAEHCFRRASELDPDDAQTWNNLGVCLWKLDRVEEAQRCFQSALEIDPEDADARFNLQHLV